MLSFRASSAPAATATRAARVLRLQYDRAGEQLGRGEVQGTRLDAGIRSLSGLEPRSSVEFDRSSVSRSTGYGRWCVEFVDFKKFRISLIFISMDF